MTMMVAGVMSGTSADGINVAVLRIGDSGGAEENLPKFELRPKFCKYKSCRGQFEVQVSCFGFGLIRNKLGDKLI